MKKITFLLLFLSTLFSYSQCNVMPSTLSQRIQNADLVIEGELITSTPFKMDGTDLILTKHDIKVTKEFKNNTGLSEPIVSLVTKGGVLGLEFNLVSGELKLNKNSKGIFTLKVFSNGLYQVEGNAYGFISYSILDGKAYSVEKHYHNYQEVYDEIITNTGVSYTVKAPTSFSPNPFLPKMVAISGMTPLNINAGAEEILTINGSGFGNSQGTQEIFFQNADNGGGFSLTPDPTQVLSWTDTQIQVLLPSGAGNGQVALADVDPNTGGFFATDISAQSLAVGFNHVNLTFPPQAGIPNNSVTTVSLFNDNGSGGYDYNYTADAANGFINEPDAVATMDDLFEKWRCTTGVNLNRGADLSPSAPANTNNPQTSGADNINVLKFDGNDFPAGSGTLAFVLTRGGGCILSNSTISAFASEMDVVINDAINWHFRDGGSQSATLDGNEFDFESVMLHELGHAQQLGHVIDPSKVMHFAIAANTMSRDIDLADVIGGNFVNSNSTAPNPCGVGSMSLSGCNFVYENAAWTPIDPSGTFNPISNIEVRNGTSQIVETLGTNNITIDNGATWANSSANPVVLLGDITNNGAANFDFLSVQGSGTQNLSGNPINFGELRISNSGSLVANTTVNITELLRPNSGTFNTNGNLVLKSDASGTAVVDEMNSVINGLVTVENYYPSRRAFRFISSSVNSSNTIFDNWQEGGVFNSGLGTHITGSVTGANGFDSTSSGNPSLFVYDNTGTNGWSAVTSTNTPSDIISSGTPYRLFVRGDRDPVLLTSVQSNNTTLRTTGSLNSGTVNGTSLSNNANGFNFVGNPFQAPIDMETVLTSGSTNLKPSYFVWDPRLNTRGAYVTINTVSGVSSNNSSAANKYAQPMQAFFVQTDVNGSANIAFNQSDKEVNQNNNQINSTNSTAIIRAKLKDVNQNTLDGFTILFDSNFDNNITNMDASKFTNIDENIAIQSQSQLLSIEEREFPTDGEIIPLHHSKYRQTQYQYEFNIIGTISPFVYLKDNFTGIIHSLNPNAINTIDFSVNLQDNTSIDPNRFQLQFENQVLTNDDIQEDLFSLYPNPSNGDFTISLFSDSSIDIVIYNMLGQEVWKTASTNGKIVPVSTGLNSGTYLVTIYQDEQKQTKKIVIK